MAQPKNFGFGTEEQMLKTEARKFFKKNSDELKLMDLVAKNPDPHGAPECNWDKKTWMKMVDLGWTSLAVPERADGAGMSTVGVAGLVEECGRAAFPCPLLATIHAGYLLASCQTDEADRILKQIASGKGASLAIMDRNGSWLETEDNVTVDASDSLKMNGTAWFVQDAGKVDLFIVRADFNEGCVLVAVPCDANGVSIIPDAIVDRTRDQAHIKFTDVNIRKQWVVCPPAKGHDVIGQSEPFIYTMIAADMCGAGEWQLQKTVDYAKTREQFGRPIGFFQAIKHPIVDMMIMIDEAKSLVYNAACALDTEPELAARYAHMAKSSAGDMAGFTSDRSIQFHGGMGFTWEAFVHLYFKRQLHHRNLFGDGRYHRARLADLMIGESRST